jgi:uncharacterized protein YndB with AHSA1/START domain
MRSFTGAPGPDVPTSTTHPTLRRADDERMAAARSGYVARMAEFEAERGMAADAERVFALVSDLDRLPSWLPSPVDVRSTGDGEVHADVPERGVDAEGTVQVRPEQLRVEWGHAPDYAGWLQVEHADPGRSSVVLHLSFLGDQPETHGGAPAEEVRRWLDDSLGRLERLVAEG